MSDIEIFIQVLERLAEQYRLTIVRPDGDQYFELFESGKLGGMIGAMNPDGYNLLHNLSRLCKMLEGKLR